MNIHHIFIFTNNEGKVADQLIALGFTEGSNRIHDGQGTRNRTFAFENFYLELLWVHSEEEIKSDLVLPTGLWTRANFKRNNSSPFGLCVNNTEESDPLFNNSFQYQPTYFPAGMPIEILNHNSNFCLPFTFRLPFKQGEQALPTAAIHKNGIATLTNAEFEFTEVSSGSFPDYFRNEAEISFSQTNKIWLTLTFDNAVQRLTKVIDELQLTIHY